MAQRNVVWTNTADVQFAVVEKIHEFSLRPTSNFLYYIQRPPKTPVTITMISND